MTSELKPCPFCWPEPHMTECHQDDYGYWKVSCGRCGCHSGIRPKSDPDARSKVITHWNTRTVPDVPELVRYSPKDYKQGMCFDSDGEYVRYDKAVTMLVAKDAEIERLRGHVAGLVTWIEDEVGAELPFAIDRTALSGKEPS